MSKILDFKTFCIEAYKLDKGMTGKDVANLFKEYDVFSYISAFYDELHTYGHKYLVQDIDIYINARRKEGL